MAGPYPAWIDKLADGMAAVRPRPDAPRSHAEVMTSMAEIEAQHKRHAAAMAARYGVPAEELRMGGRGQRVSRVIG